MLDPVIAEKLAQALGPKGFTTAADDMAPWLTDWRKIYQGRALGLASPANAAEVQAVMQIASAHGIPIVPQGGNSSMVGGATPDAQGTALILSTRRMNKIRTLDAEANIVVAEAGVILAHLHEAARAQGRRFPLTLGARGSATIGGLVSTNAGGTQVLRFGTMRKLVLGIEAVLPDGQLYEGLAALKKDNRGYDLTQLLVAAEGTLGVITAASLRLVPDILDRAVGWIGVASPDAALTLLRRLEAASGDAIESFELVPDSSLQLVLQHIPGARAPLTTSHKWHVLVEYVRSHSAAPAPDAALEALLAEAMEAGLCEDAALAASEAQAEAFWKLRDSISEAERAHGPAMQHDISVPVEAMPRFIREASAAVEAAFPDVSVNAYGHLGDGNVHFHVRAPNGVNAPDWRASIGKAASHMVYDLVTAAGGSISAEHGIGQMKRDELARLSSPARIAALRAIKGALDPQGLMNPGKLVP
ncbi:MAG: FAD-binding oxidoreductase [Alphaproteobacteria bacterium]|nr:FAD-binding oxidoreductase [Alphaproteobacteria bacterium]